MEAKKTIVILALLGDPMIPATSRNTRAGGFNTDVREWISKLSKTDYPIAVITNTSSVLQTPIQKISSQIILYRVPMEESSFKNPSALMDQFPYVYHFIKNLLRENFIIPAFFHSYFWYSGAFAMQLSVDYEVPFIHTIIDLSAYKKISGSTANYQIQESSEKALFPKASCIMAITEEEKRIFLQNYNVAENKVVVTGRESNHVFLHPDHNTRGVARDFLLENQDPIMEDLPSHVNFTSLNSGWWNSGAYLYMGRLQEMKGVPIIIQTWYQLYEQFGEHTPPLWIVGGLPDAIENMRAQIKEKIPSLTVLENSLKLCWWGYLSPQSISALLLKTAVLVTHSQYEAGGLVAIEAMSSGVPVIATPTGFSADCIRNWENGFIVPYLDIELLEQRMEHFIQQPLLSRSLGAFAKSTYKFFTKCWNCYEKHFYIYEQFWNHTDANELFLQSQTALWFEQEKSEFRRGIINTYPFHSPFAKKNVYQYCKKVFPNIKELEITFEKNLSEQSDIWDIHFEKQHYMFKYVYSMLNKNKIWNTNILEEAISSAKRVHCLAFCETSKVVYHVFFMDRENHFCILPKADNILYLSRNSSLDKILTLIRSFNLGNWDFQNNNVKKEELKCNFISKDLFTLTNLWNDLIFPESRENKKFSLFIAPYVLELEKYMLEAGKSSCEMCINYGKPFSGHIVISDTGYQLLPSDSIFWGERGFDPALLLFEYWSNVHFPSEQELFTDIQKVSAAYPISTKRLILWCTLLAILSIKKNFVMEAVPNNAKYMSIMEACINILSK